MYNITFTCKVCSNRSSHFMSHQAYHNGTVLIKCPSCNNRHLIADHLKIFSDKPVTVEDLVDEKQIIKKAKLEFPSETRGDLTEFTTEGSAPADSETK
ncbi:DNL zinc finger-domain-containing protein [Lipomyces japonicus]|uniref:DNL zinc finger-domain-containing protein n=1 Tax=Lipomyces japonicus TaxID=56871 RepID=UPI0034CD24E0